MRLATRTLLLLSLFMLACRQAYATDPTLRGSVVVNPERISGSWESTQFGSIMGLHIKLTTIVNGTPTSLVGVKQFFHDAQIQVYQRAGPSRTSGDGQWFDDNSSGVQWIGNHLTVAFIPNDVASTVHLNLTFDSRHEIWRGHWQTGNFDRYVILIRPHPETRVPSSPFLGTWHRNTPMNNCLHIVQTGAGTLSGWSDDLISPGLLQYANGLKPPSETLEQYGSITLIEIASPTTLLLELKAFSAGCCSIPSSLRITNKKERLLDSQSGQPPSSNWQRLRGASCTPT